MTHRRRSLAALVLVLCAGALCALAAGPARAAGFVLGPPDGPGPTVVSVGFLIDDVSEIDDQLETVDFQARLTTRWHDPRQAFDPAVVGVRERVYQGDYQFNEVFTGWWPQLVLENGSGGVESRAVLVRIQPDGTVTLVHDIAATAKVSLDLRRFPFDHQELPFLFEVLGFDESVVVLREDPSTTGSEVAERLAEWQMDGLHTQVVRVTPDLEAGRAATSSRYVATLSVARQPGFILRQVAMPLVVLVALTWSVFWMEKSSLGDRMSISFIGILSVIAYQLVVQESMPKIGYTTLTHVFLTSTYFLLAASVVVNLVVEYLDRRAEHATADRLDHICRWAFPLGFVVFTAAAAVYFFALGS